MDFTARTLKALEAVSVLPRRLLLETPGMQATVPMLRGVWGAALHDLEPQVYASVFAPNDEPPRRQTIPSGSAGPHRAAAALAVPALRSRVRNNAPRDGQAPRQGDQRPAAESGGGTSAPAYVIRPAPPDPVFAPAVDWILIGDAVQYDFPLCRAWDIASGMGLGPERRRFHIRRWLALQPDGRAVEHAVPWALNEARWLAVARPDQQSPSVAAGSSPTSQFDEISPDQPCRLHFTSPLRLMRQGRLIETPTLPDLIVAACRRVAAYLPPAAAEEWKGITEDATDAARSTPASSWEGERLDLHRYSARQRAELDLRGVSGWLELPRGPGPLWPILASAQWLHLGKGTVMGLGQLLVERLDGTRTSTQ